MGAAGWLLGAAVAAEESPPVTLSLRHGFFVLENGILTARIDSRSGVLRSLRYEGWELLAQQSPGGALGGYWSWVGRMTVGPRREARVRVNPADTGGELAEVSTEFLQEPGRERASVEMSLRYAMRRGEPCLYISAVWRHQPGDPPLRVGEARYVVKLNPDLFDFLSVDAARQRLMPRPEDWDQGLPTNLKEARRLVTGQYAGTVEHKYDYAARLYEIPAYGWSSTRARVGIWVVQPSWESVAGGPTKVELTGHLDVNPGGTPTLLWMWLGSHYGGSSLVVDTHENWSKFIGPVVLYCNGNRDPAGLWQDALDRARWEAGRWPYDWVRDPDYPLAEQRATVRGRIVVEDPGTDPRNLRNVWVGLTAPDYPMPMPRRWGAEETGTSGSRSPDPGTARQAGAVGPGSVTDAFGGRVTWQRDAKQYQFWVRARPDGSFEIPHVRAGRLVLRAIAEGVLGEYAGEPLEISAGEALDLGTVVWRPERFGRTLWEIGVPDRTAREFRHGEHYWQWGLYLRYPEEFPQDVDFEIGRSDWRRDWNYVQPPRILEWAGILVSEEDDAAAEGDHEATSEAGQGVGRPRLEPSTWTIRFGLPGPVRGRAVLRLAICGAGPGCRVEVAVNGRPVGDTGLLPPTSTMHRDGIEGYWVERRVWFDAALLQSGENRISLHVPAVSWTQGVLYDYLRLELVEEEPGQHPTVR